MISRNDALALLNQHNSDPYILRHSLATEAIMRVLAKRFGEDENLWGTAGLLHDIDYGETKNTPEEHGVRALSLLAGKMPEEALKAIQAHNDAAPGAPETRFDYALRAAETVTGLIIAAALMRPTGMEGMEVKSIKKKMKDKSFAASVDRNIIRECEKIGLTLDEFLSESITAMAACESGAANAH